MTERYGERHPELDGARIFLQPIAAPSIVGLYGFAIATFMVAANLARWYGTDLAAQTFVVPFAIFSGGLAQFLAGMWAFRARDALATAMHSMWGSFWIGYGLLILLNAAGVITVPTAFGKFVPLGYWFIPLSIITLTGAVAALRVNLLLAMVLFFLGMGSAWAVAAFFHGNLWLFRAAGYSFIVSAFFAWWTATGLMFEAMTGREIPPLIDLRKKPEVVTGAGEPGVIVGQ